jgi:hypothetical protein
MNERNLEDHHLIILVIKAYDYCMGFRPARGGAYRKRFGVISCVSVVVFSFEKSEEKKSRKSDPKIGRPEMVITAPGGGVPSHEYLAQEGLNPTPPVQMERSNRKIALLCLLPPFFTLFIVRLIQYKNYVNTHKIK